MMTKYEQPLDDFLSIFYSGMEVKLKRIIELNSADDLTSTETKELYETKGNLLEALDYMHRLTHDVEIKELFNVLGSLIVSTETHKLTQALNFCSSMNEV